MRSRRSFLRIIAIALLSVVSLLAVFVLARPKDHGAKEHSRAETTPPSVKVWREGDFDQTAAPDDDCSDDTGWLNLWLGIFQLILAKTPPLAVLVGLLCCVFLGPRWLRITICLIVLAIAIECKWADKLHESHPSECHCQIARNDYPALQTLFHPNIID